MSQQLEVNTTKAEFLIVQSAPLSLTSLSPIPYVRNLRITCSFPSVRSSNLIYHQDRDSTSKMQLPPSASHLRSVTLAQAPMTSLFRPLQQPPNWSPPCFWSWPPPAPDPFSTSQPEFSAEIRNQIMALHCVQIHQCLPISLVSAYLTPCFLAPLSLLPSCPGLLTVPRTQH